MKEQIKKTDGLGEVYVPGTSILHRMNPAHKILMTFLILVAIAAAGNRELVFLGGVCLALGLFAGLKPLAAVYQLRKFAWFFLALVIFPAVFIVGEPVEEFYFLPFSVSHEGLAQGLIAMTKVALVFLVSMILLRTTKPDEMIESFGGRYGKSVPTTWWGEFLFIAVMAMRSIPHILSQAEKVFSTNLKHEEGTVSLAKKITAVTTLLTPLIVSVFQSGDIIAENDDQPEG